LALPYNETIGEVTKQFKVPGKEIFLILHKDINTMRCSDLNSGIERERVLKDGDVLALSGLVTRSRGHGARIV